MFTFVIQIVEKQWKVESVIVISKADIRSEISQLEFTFGYLLTNLAGVNAFLLSFVTQITAQVLANWKPIH